MTTAKTCYSVDGSDGGNANAGVHTSDWTSVTFFWLFSHDGKLHMIEIYKRIFVDWYILRVHECAHLWGPLDADEAMLFAVVQPMPGAEITQNISESVVLECFLNVPKISYRKQIRQLN